MIRLAPFVLGIISFGVVEFPSGVHAQAITGDYVVQFCSSSEAEMFCVGTFTIAAQFLEAGCFQARHFEHRADLVEADLSGVSAVDVQSEFLYRMNDPAFYAEFGNREAVFGIGRAAGERWPCR